MKQTLASFGISNGAACCATLPTELKLLPWGDSTVMGNKLIRMGEITRKVFAQMQKASGRDRVALDFEHNTVKGTEAYKDSKEPRPVAAYGVPDLRTDGLWLSDLVWTPEGKENAMNYYDLSPTVGFDKNNEVLYLHSVALTRAGSVENLHFYSVDSCDMPLMNDGNTNPEQEVTMMDKILALLRKGLGLTESATEDDIAQAMSKTASFSAQLTGLKEQIATLSVDATVKTKIESLEGQIKAFSIELENKDRAAISAQAKREGKVIPLSAEEVAKMPVATLKAMCEKLPVTVPVTQRTPDDVVAHSINDSSVITENQKMIAAKCGVTFPVKAAVALVALLSMISVSFGTALQAERNTVARSGEMQSLTMASNVIIYAGSLVCIDSTGKANPAADTSGFSVVGRAHSTVDNRTAVYKATKTIQVDRGCFRWENADTIVAADIGKLVYVTDDQTVNKTGGGQNIIAGSIVDVDSLGVWVDTAKIGPIGATTPSSLTVAANASVGGTLAVTGNQTNTANVGVGGTVNVSGATTLGSTLSVAGQTTFTAVPKLGAALGTPGNVTFVVTNAPVGASTIPKWIKILDANGTTNYVPCLQY